MSVWAASDAADFASVFGPSWVPKVGESVRVVRPAPGTNERGAKMVGEVFVVERVDRYQGKATWLTDGEEYVVKLNERFGFGWRLGDLAPVSIHEPGPVEDELARLGAVLERLDAYAGGR